MPTVVDTAWIDLLRGAQHAVALVDNNENPNIGMLAAVSSLRDPLAALEGAHPLPQRAPSERMAAALERIAAALERQADADPLEVLGLALRDDAPQTRSDAPQPATATNGQIALYQHPSPGWEIVARRNKDAESGWIVTEERTV